MDSPSDPKESTELKDSDKSNSSGKPTTKDEKPVTVPASTPMSARFVQLKKSLPADHPRVRMLAGVLVIIIAASAGFLGGWAGNSERDDSQTTIQKQQVVLENQGQLISSIAKNVGQSVVSINSTQNSSASSSSLDGLFGYSNGGGGEEESAGTGIILTDSGLIITNRHVVPEGSTDISVTLSNGTTFNNVKVVGRTSQNDSLDIAFLQIQDTNGHKLVPAQIGNSSKMSVGDSVVAIGNALGQYQNTVTTGIISGYGRSVQASDSTGTSTENLTDLFQTDAAINEGNSGGPLVNLNGQVVGINTAIASSAQNIGFSIPINDVTGLIKSVEQTGKLQQPYLGVIYVPITSDIAKQYNLSVSTGAYIPTSGDAGGEQTVLSGSPAAKAGVQPGDIITKINGTVIDQQHSITSVLDQQAVGAQATLTIIRNGKQISATVTLGSAPTNND
jgi:S1-C subfamily serine protease